MLVALLPLALALAPAGAGADGALEGAIGTFSRGLLEARVSDGRALVLRDADGTERGVASCEVVRGLTRIVHQREVVFPSGGVRLLQTEEIEGTRRRLVFRELRTNGARTWVAEWDTRTGASTTKGYGWRRPTHGTLGRTPENLPPAMGALEMLDQLERGLLRPGDELGLVDPATAAVIDVRVSRGPSGPSVCRADGTEVLGLGAGGDGRAVRLGGRVWSRADEALAARLAGRWRVPIVANHERVLGALRSGRIERRSTPRAAR